MLLRSTKFIDDLLDIPAYEATGLGDMVVDTSPTETYTHLWDPNDANSDVLISRDKEVNAAGEVITASRWVVTNAPTISTVTSDLISNSTVSLSGTTTLTITGTNYGASDADIEVFVLLPMQHTGGLHGTPCRAKSAEFQATITSINVGDTEITATLLIADPTGLRKPVAGSCFVSVKNKKRLLQSEPFEMTLV